ncbi:FAD-dependent monooxygenase [Solicola sp. PLA-1-18]|uniref:FAD-dependent monooxygenase n=1 Tax=Solicola sp. PLA-1-18 TaxID=3380532 RepID=UPI003B797215
MEQVDVAVVGAGPAGLVLAAEVARTGRSVVVLDRRREPSPLSRAFGVHARTLELLDSRGIAEELVATGRTVDRLALLGHAGVDLARLPSRFPFVLMTPQVNVDRLLERHARDVGARVLRGAEVTSLRQDDGAVEVTVRAADDAQLLRASWVVGADGAHSTVRELVGADFPGVTVLRSIMLADVRLADPPDGLISVDAADGCFAFVAPFGDGWFRVIAWDRELAADDDAPVDPGDVRRAVRRAFGTDHGWGEVRWSSRFHSDERQVARYRHGRVLLVGDAAHVHSPAGGQGMNTGIQDAANLGWKLAAVLDGADHALLDTYQDERHPVGRLVLRTSGATIRLMTWRTRPAVLVRRVLLGGLLRLPPVARRAAGTFSGVAIAYGRGRGGHRLVGTRAGDVPLVDGRLAEAQRDAGFVLVLGPGAPDVDAPATVVRRADHGPSLLVRPDGYVAWAGEPSDGGWRMVLERWAVRTRPTPGRSRRR